jgi:hypothetical protein
MVGGSINIGGGNFTVDSNGNVGVASSINLSAGGDLTFGTNGSITTVLGWKCTNIIFKRRSCG